MKNIPKKIYLQKEGGGNRMKLLSGMGEILDEIL